MNGFRLIGDILHFLAATTLLVKILKTGSCRGISGNTQKLFAAVYTTRYLDLFIAYISFYLTAAKIFLITVSYTTCYLIYRKFKLTSEQDVLHSAYLVIPAILLSNISNYSYDVVEVWWAFSCYLESVAILPQLFMIIHAKKIERDIMWYLCLLAGYIAFYIQNWIYRYLQRGYYDQIHFASGILQFLIYCSFFIYRWHEKIEIYTETVKIEHDDIEKILPSEKQNENSGLRECNLRNCELILNVSELKENKVNLKSDQLDLSHDLKEETS